jgi:hypothetical protein
MVQKLKAHTKKLKMNGGDPLAMVQNPGILSKIWGWIKFLYNIYAFIMLNMNSLIIVISLFIVNAILVGIQKLSKEMIIGPIIKSLHLPKNVFDLFAKMIISFF